MGREMWGACAAGGRQRATWRHACVVGLACIVGACLAAVDEDACSDHSCESSLPVSCRDVAPAHAQSDIVEVTIGKLGDGSWEQPADCAWKCEPDYFNDGDACINERSEPCKDVAPEHAVSQPAEVTTTYSDADGWSEPDACLYVCEPDFALEDAMCIHEKLVDCVDATPPNATSMPIEVSILYSDAGGWSEPDECPFSCNEGFCEQSGQCVEPIEVISFSTGNGASWFGGDNRPKFGPRNMGGGQSVTLSKTFELSKFGFHYQSRFDFKHEPKLSGHEVTLVLDVRSWTGVPLASAEVVVPASFNGGWVYWDIVKTLQPGQYVFTCYLKNGLALGLTSGMMANSQGGYADGQRFGGVIYSGSESLADWTKWNPVGAWDYHFHMQSAPKC